MLKWKEKNPQPLVVSSTIPLKPCKTGILNYSVQMLMVLDLNAPSAHAHSLAHGQEQLLLLLMMAPQKLQNVGTVCEI